MQKQSRQVIEKYGTKAYLSILKQTVNDNYRIENTLQLLKSYCNKLLTIN